MWQKYQNDFVIGAVHSCTNISSQNTQQRSCWWHSPLTKHAPPTWAVKTTLQTTVWCSLGRIQRATPLLQCKWAARSAGNGLLSRPSEEASSGAPWFQTHSGKKKHGCSSRTPDSCKYRFCMNLCGGPHSFCTPTQVSVHFLLWTSQLKQKGKQETKYANKPRVTLKKDAPQGGGGLFPIIGGHLCSPH